MLDFAKEGLANFLSIFSTYWGQTLTYFGATKRRLFISASVLFSFLMYVGTELYVYHLEQITKNPRDAIFKKGLDIAELRSAVDYLKVCETESNSDGSNAELYCSFATEKYVFITATYGKRGLEGMKSAQDPNQYISDFDRELLTKKAYPLMQAKLLAQVKRSENAMKNSTKQSFISKLLGDIRYANYLAYILIFVCCIITTGFMLHAKSAASQTQN